jgi:HK97 family phage prohead protease
MPHNNAALPGTEYKAMQGQVNIDEAEGIIECFVAGLGNKDSVGDICLPGCFTESLKRRKPRVVWGHNWNEPIGKVIEIYEVGPNDPRLPMKMKRAGIGGLYAKVQFNLKSERGRQAFADVAFFGEEQEWSIGYKTLNADYDSQRQANLLREVELYEVSPVLHGANQLTSTISIKSDEPLRDPDGGLTAAGRRHFNETEGSNLKPGVKGPADTPEKMRRKGSFLTRFFTNPSGPMKDEKGEPTRLALSAAAWGEPVPQNMEDAAELAAKGRRMLDRYQAQKEKGYDLNERLYDIDREEDDDSEYTGPRGPDGGVPAANPAMGRAGNLAKALAMRFGGAVRLRTADANMVVFDHMDKDGNKQTLRVTYHFDGDEFMFGNAVKVKPETVYLNVDDNDSEEEMPQRNGNPAMRQYQREMEEYPGLPEGVKPKICKCAACSGGGSDSMDIPLSEPSVKAPVPEVGIPQERFTGDVLQGRGPRRGNLEALLRYWRPIMRREGGFRRCRVILADHPELYPLERICAWLHHETTGLWPNEGCHHPGMKNCRNKIRGVTNGSIWNDREWNDRLSRIPSPAGAGKGLDMMEDEDMSSMTPGQIEGKAAEMLKSFLAEQPEFVKFIEDAKNWEHAGDDENGILVIHRRNMGSGMGMGHDGHNHGDDDDCGCGCGGAGDCKPKPVQAIMAALAQLGKSLDEEMQTKAGRMISNRNLQKLQQAMEILQDVVAASAPSKEPVVQVKADGQMRIVAPIDSLFSVKSLIDPILEFHEIDSQVDETGIYFGSSVSSEAKSAMINALTAYKELHNKENH